MRLTIVNDMDPDRTTTFDAYPASWTPAAGERIARVEYRPGLGVVIHVQSTSTGRLHSHRPAIGSITGHHTDWWRPPMTMGAISHYSEMSHAIDEAISVETKTIRTVRQWYPTRGYRPSWCGTRSPVSYCLPATG